jgi:OsmC-like protein
VTAVDDRQPPADTGPTPGTLLRMAIGSCAATTLAMRAAAEGIPLARVEVVVSGESDHRGLLGVGGSRPGRWSRGWATGWRRPACPPTGCGPWPTGRSGTRRCPPPPAARSP